MRVFGTLFVALLISLAANGVLLKWNTSLRDERDAALAEVATLEQARAADAAAYALYDKARLDAAATAQRRRDALNAISPADSESDVLRRCRDGLCISDKARRSDTSSGASEALQKTREAGRADGR